MTRMTEQALTEEVVVRLAATPDERVRTVMQALVRHLHAFVGEVRVSEAEWAAAIGFLTAIGQLSGPERQEFVLLSDTLGVSSLVDLVNHGADDEELTESTILGPFYVPESPWREFGASMVEYEDGGAPAVLRGTVRGPGGEPIAGATLDVWQNAATGYYAVQQPGVQPATNLRGRYRSDAAGRFEIRTVRPVPYRSRRRAGRADAGRDRPAPLARGPHPRHRDRAGPPPGRHAHLRPGQRSTSTATPCSA